MPSEELNIQKTERQRKVRRNAGFTLIELLIVLSILSMSYLLISPFLFGMGSSSKLAATAHDVAAEFRVLKSRAMMTGNVIVFEMIKDGGGYKISGEKREYLLSSGIHFQKSNEDINKIWFYPDGSVSHFFIVLYLKEQRRSIFTEDFTSRIIVQ
jgi:prepilin-type N-terminal cleavage/methylation domain-containing protein